VKRQPVRVFGGPLDGGVYELEAEPGALIELNSAAGVCTYQFGTGQGGEHILQYIAVGPLDGGLREGERI
jgi:hypothetical protein